MPKLSELNHLSS